MKTIQVKTNIMCGSCVSKVTNLLDETIGKGNWTVDIQDAKKVLTVKTDNLNEEEIIQFVEKAGYKAEKLSYI